MSVASCRPVGIKTNGALDNLRERSPHSHPQGLVPEAHSQSKGGRKRGPIAHRHLQCNPSRPDVHLKAREGVQAIGNLRRLECWGTLARPACVILSERVQGL